MTKLRFALRAVHPRRLLLAGAAFLAVITPNTSAMAATQQICNPTLIGYNSTATSSYVAMVCSGTAYYAWTANAPTGCTAVSADAAKSWVSLAQSAVLSGKKVTLYFTPCGSSNWNYISEIDLDQ